MGNILSISKDLTEKEFDKITRNERNKKTVQIYRYCVTPRFIGSIEVRQGQLCAVVYSKSRYGTTNEPVRELLSFPAEIGHITKCKKTVKYSNDEYYYGKDPEIYGYPKGYTDNLHFEVEAIINYDKEEANTYKDILGNILSVGDKVVYSNSRYAILNVGTIEKLNNCTARIDGYNVDYCQIAKVTK